MQNIHLLSMQGILIGKVRENQGSFYTTMK